MSVYENPPDPLAPRRPWDFFRVAWGGFRSPQTLHFLGAWLTLQGLTSALWARHLQQNLGSSAMANYWGDVLASRDVWDLLQNGGLQQHPAGAPTTLAFWGCLLWVLWRGWSLQAKEVGLEPRFRAWIWGFLDACLIGLLPIAMLAYAVTSLFSAMASTGIQWLGWLNLVGGALVKLSAGSAFLLQWWLCRLERAAQPDPGWRMGGWEQLGQHLAQSFVRQWMHFVQWTGLILLGVLFRLGCFLGAMMLAWRWGGGTVTRVATQLGLFALAMLLAASALAWFMRLVAHFWQHDHQIRLEIQQLKLRARGQ